TPNKGQWERKQPRLWPFYLLKEFTSQTNDLTDYCYLTDGGHFDNTGLYSLVERGCKYIVVADCGADREPTFSDLGDAIRRCRIDFGAEIELDITPFINGAARGTIQHCIAGTILYSEKHLEQLGWDPLPPSATEPDRYFRRRGIILIIKP